MKWCRFQVGDKVSYGIVEDEARVIEVSGTPFETYTVTATTYPLSAVKLLVPVIPPTFYAGGLNYPDHVQWWAQYSGTPPRVATEPGIGYRTNNALIAHEEHIVKPKDASDEFQVEGELVAVIGKKARHLSPENALSCVLGYTIGNDVSQRPAILPRSAGTARSILETSSGWGRRARPRTCGRGTWWRSRSAASVPSGTLWWPRSRQVCSRFSILPSGGPVFQRAVAQGRRHIPADTGEHNVGVCDHGVYSLGTDGLTGVTRGVWRWRDRPGVGAYH